MSTNVNAQGDANNASNSNESLAVADDFMPTNLTPAEAERLLKEVDYVLFDVDGVIWSGDHVIYQVPEMLYWLARDMGKKIRFMTNNATRTRAATRDEFVHKGITFVQSDMIYSSAYVAALELKSRWKERRSAETEKELNTIANPFESSSNNELQKEGASTTSDALESSFFRRQQSIAKLESDRFPHNVFVIGEKGLHDELREVAMAPDAITVGLELVPNPSSEYPLLRSVTYPSILKAMDEPIIPVGVRVLKSGHGLARDGAAPDSMCLQSIDQLDCGAVIVGLDRNMNMLKGSLASLVLQRAEKRPNATPCDFIATNEDPSITIGAEGYHFPGAGSCVAMLKAATGRDPDYVCGKPHLLMAKVFMENEGVTDPSRCLMVGDRLTTDIAFGRGMGARTLFVLTGAETLKDVAAAPAAIRPEFVAQSAANLLYTAE